MSHYAVPKPPPGVVNISYRYRLVLVDLKTGMEQGILCPPGTKQVTVALPDNVAEFKVEDRKVLYLAVGKAGVEGMRELPEGEGPPSLPREKCLQCGREL